MKRKLLFTLLEICFVWFVVNGTMFPLADLNIVNKNAQYETFLVSSIVVIPVLMVGVIVLILMPRKKGSPE